MLCFEPDRDKLDIQLQAAREAVDHAENNIREATAAWQEKEWRYRWIIRELAYAHTIGWDTDKIELNLRRLGIDAELLESVLQQHEERREKDSMNA